MTVLHSGSNNKYSSNWARAFGKGKGNAGSGQKKSGSGKSAKSKKK